MVIKARVSSTEDETCVSCNRAFTPGKSFIVVKTRSGYLPMGFCPSHMGDARHRYAPSSWIRRGWSLPAMTKRNAIERADDVNARSGLANPMGREPELHIEPGRRLPWYNNQGDLPEDN